MYVQLNLEFWVKNVPLQPWVTPSEDRPQIWQSWLGPYQTVFPIFPQVVVESIVVMKGGGKSPGWAEKAQRTDTTGLQV